MRAVLLVLEERRVTVLLVERANLFLPTTNANSAMSNVSLVLECNQTSVNPANLASI